ncbi:MAG: hypothetical protein SZ59_C0002G0016 [candidate division TM6 bacterium GW2011_GWF2_28_16]|nr:MAG: hypothetical protein SZ59_C0002G0016 [candidate division TM6 bacterium GW2011_GWF2_28_16]
MENKNSFELKIVSPTSEKKIQLEWLDVKTDIGDFFVGPDHEDLIAILKDRSKISYKVLHEANSQAIDIYSGFIKIYNKQVLIVVDL